MENATLLSIVAISISGLPLIWNILWSLHREFATPRLKVPFHAGAIYIINGKRFFREKGAISETQQSNSV